MSKFLDSAASRETSIEIMRAIYEIAGYDDDLAVDIWEDPTSDQIAEIADFIESETGCFFGNEFCWGASGYYWYV